MTYFRLRDVTTPPYAYVANREDAVSACELCMMPFAHLDTTLEVEIFTTQIAGWEKKIIGKPLMAEYWLIGDELFGEKFRSIAGEDVASEPVTIVSWLTRNKSMQSSQALGAQRDTRDLPRFFRYYATRGVPIDSNQCQTYPPIECSSCQRCIPDIPMDIHPIPQSLDSAPPFAHLDDLHLEGYDYLFRGDIARKLMKTFPEMILEPLRGEPTLF